MNAFYAPRKILIVTKLLVADGDIVVIGGIKKNNVANSKEQTPGIGNVPVIGNLFKGKQQEDTLDELLFRVVWLSFVFVWLSFVVDWLFVWLSLVVDSELVLLDIIWGDIVDIDISTGSIWFGDTLLLSPSVVLYWILIYY